MGFHSQGSTFTISCTVEPTPHEKAPGLLYSMLTRHKSAKKLYLPNPLSLERYTSVISKPAAFKARQKEEQRLKDLSLRCITQHQSKIDQITLCCCGCGKNVGLNPTLHCEQTMNCIYNVACLAPDNSGICILCRELNCH